jgi:hypothetical protein
MKPHYRNEERRISADASKPISPQFFAELGMPLPWCLTQPIQALADTPSPPC